MVGIKKTGRIEAGDIVRVLGLEFGIDRAQLAGFLDRFGQGKAAGCSWSCSGHNLPQHKK